MADHSKPVLTDTYANFLNYIVARIADATVMLDPAFTTATMLPNGAIRWDSVNKYWAQYNGTTWAALPIGFAPLVSPAFAGTPTAPTAVLNDNSTKVATTAYYIKQASTIAPTMNGTAKIGTSFLFARSDHIHPTDTSKAPINSPALTGIPTAPTATAGTNTTQIATTAFIQAALSALVASSPAALDTLNELALALGNDANFATTMTNALALKAPLASPILTGNPTAPTPATGDNDTSIATTAFVMDAVRNQLPNNSQTFTSSGVFTVPNGVTKVMAYIASGGGGGGGGKAINSSTSASGGGGGASEFVPPSILTVTPGQVLSVTIGNGGAGGAGLAYSQAYTIGSGGNGGASSIGGITVMGSPGGTGANATATGGNGGANSLGVVAGVNATAGSVGLPAQGGLGVSRATGGSSGTNAAVGVGGTSSINNGANGVAGVNGWGGAGGAGGAGKVIVYW